MDKTRKTGIKRLTGYADSFEQHLDTIHSANDGDVYDLNTIYSPTSKPHEL